MDFAYTTVSSHGASDLTRFYAQLTGQPVTMDEGAYTILGDGAGPRLAFQRVAAGRGRRTNGPVADEVGAREQRA